MDIVNEWIISPIFIVEVRVKLENLRAEIWRLEKIITMILAEFCGYEPDSS